MKFWTDFRPATGALAALVGFLAVGAAAETTNTLTDAKIQGRKLAQQLCDAMPEINYAQYAQTGYIQTGTLKIRGATETKILSVTVSTYVTKDGWINCYQNWNGALLKSTNFTQNELETIIIIHHVKKANEYKWSKTWKDIPGPWEFGPTSESPAAMTDDRKLESNETAIPFTQSDFWLCDLGLEFFHWPAQKVLKKEVKRSRGCTVLESTNPNSPTNNAVPPIRYSRVVSWIDSESGGIVQAEAYDANGKLLKEFAPKSFKKVNGQWELQEMEIRNVQTGSRTRLEFDLKK